MEWKFKSALTVRELAGWLKENNVLPGQIVFGDVSESGSLDVVVVSAGEPAGGSGPVLPEAVSPGGPVAVAAAEGTTSPYGKNGVNFELLVDNFAGTADLTFTFEGAHAGDDWFTILGEVAGTPAGTVDLGPYTMTLAGVTPGTRLNLRVPVGHNKVRMLMETTAAVEVTSRRVVVY